MYRAFLDHRQSDLGLDTIDWKEWKYIHMQDGRYANNFDYTTGQSGTNQRIRLWDICIAGNT